jgi:hypothetical protein
MELDGDAEKLVLVEGVMVGGEGVRQSAAGRLLEDGGFHL